jgi:HPt (histidine-containing phosphotransfer) domain-containing protein
MDHVATVPPAAEGIIDVAAVLERFEGDWELIREVAELFLDDCPRRIEVVRQAIAAGDCAELQRAAHSLKGSMSNFSGAAAVQAALRLELMGRNGDLHDAEDARATLEREVARLTTTLVQVLHEARGGSDAHPAP